MLRSPCPKCREPMLAGATKCYRCGYRLMSWESSRARRLAILEVLFFVTIVGVAIYVYRLS